MRKILCEIDLEKAQGYPRRYLEHFSTTNRAPAYAECRESIAKPGLDCPIACMLEKLAFDLLAPGDPTFYKEIYSIPPPLMHGIHSRTSNGESALRSF